MQCKQSGNLITALKRNCKSIAQIHQIHGQAIAKGLKFPLLLTQILHTYTTLLALSPPPSAAVNHRRTAYLAAVFSNIPSPTSFCYNTIIRAHTLLSSPETALRFFSTMARHCISPDSHTFPFALKACAQNKSLFLAKTLHSQALRFGFLGDVFVLNNLINAYSAGRGSWDAQRVFDESPHRDLVSHNAMINVFVKAGEIGKARELFDGMVERDEVSWGTLLAGYAKMNHCRDAIELFDQMLAENLSPDNTALAAVLSACAQLGELEKGKRVHEYILKSRRRNGMNMNEFLITGLVDLYGKCGYIETAMEIFESSMKNLCTWNAMLVGLAMNGHGELLLEFFSKMVSSGVKPDRVTFLGVLVGCSHAGLTNEARKLFAEMEEVHGVPRELKHYGCMVDLLARAGLIEEAVEMIAAMPMKGDVYVWGGLLGGCRMHGNIEVAEIAASRLVEVKPEDGGVYSVLADLYSNAGRWDDLVKMRVLREGGKVKRSAGCSLVQLDGATHEFVAGDDLHPFMDEIRVILNVFEQHSLEQAW